MNTETRSGYLISEYLSNIELYYTKPENVKKYYLNIEGMDVKHIVKVMRHKIGDNIFVTDGRGKIYEGKIEEIKSESIKIHKVQIREYPEKYKNITLCIPNLRKSDRLEFAIEKAAELGITKFIVFNSKRTINKKVKIERLKKIVLSAMKQSLQSYLPDINIFKSLTFLDNSNSEILLFDQNEKKQFNDSFLDIDKKYYLLFGPEGGFEKGEISENIITHQFKLTPNRLRTETAVVCAVSKLSTLF